MIRRNLGGIIALGSATILLLLMGYIFLTPEYLNIGRYDLNNDGIVDIIDLRMCSARFDCDAEKLAWVIVSEIRSGMSQTLQAGATCSDADLNNDGVVDYDDLILLSIHYGEEGYDYDLMTTISLFYDQTCPTPTTTISIPSPPTSPPTSIFRSVMDSIFSFVRYLTRRISSVIGLHTYLPNDRINVQLSIKTINPPDMDYTDGAVRYIYYNTFLFRNEKIIKSTGWRRTNEQTVKTATTFSNLEPGKYVYVLAVVELVSSYNQNTKSWSEWGIAKTYKDKQVFVVGTPTTTTIPQPQTQGITTILMDFVNSIISWVGGIWNSLF